MYTENPEVTISFKYTEKDLYYILKDTYRIRKIPHIVITILFFVALIVLYMKGSSDKLLFMLVFLTVFLFGIFIIAYGYFLGLQAHNSYINDKGFQELQYIEIYNDKTITVLYGNATITYFTEMNKYYETRHNLLIVQNPTENIGYEKGKILLPPIKIIIIPKKYCDKENLKKIRNLLLNSQISRKHLL